VDPDWVDDITQEAFLTAYWEWGSFDPSRDFGKCIRETQQTLSEMKSASMPEEAES
jgi:hypothetical protein